MKAALNHLGVVVQDVEGAAKLLGTLGMKALTRPEPDPIQKVTACFLASEGEQGVHIELLEPTDETSPVANFLAKKGGGLHHLCFEVEDVDSAMRELEAQGL
jgi:methylmalonyl-CoA/ethylmalonyl-CoA epimerase